MSVYKKRSLKIRSLIFTARIGKSHLDHTVAISRAGLVSVHSQTEVTAVHIYSLTRKIIIVESVLSHLNFHSAGLVLNIETLIEVARLVGSAYDSGDDDILINFPWRAHLVPGSKLCNGMCGGHGYRLRRIRVLRTGEYRLKLFFQRSTGRSCNE